MSTRGWEHATPMDTRHRRALDLPKNERKPAKARRSKYGATPTTVDGIRFHSAREARRYEELKLLVKAGAITGLLLQPEYGIYAHPIGGDLVKVATYRGDFQYYTVQGKKVVEDVKGFKTPMYRLKKKFVEAQYGIEIREI